MEFSSINSIAPIANATSVDAISASRNVTGANGSAAVSSTGFSDLVQGFLHRTNSAQVVAENAIQDFATGKNDNIQQVVLAMANADMTFKFFLEIRNKVIESYNDLMRMQF
jgi:flagellar hook-basal body complex protein FliE